MTMDDDEDAGSFSTGGTPEDTKEKDVKRQQRDKGGVTLEEEK